VLDKLLLASDPTAETRRVLARMSPMRSPPRIDGVWFDPEGKRALLVAQTRAFGSDLEGQAGAVAALEQAFAASRTSGAMTLEYSSPGTMAVRSRALIAGDARTLSLVSMAGVLAILAWAYRSPAVVALCVLPALCGLLAGVLIVDAGFGSIHGITLAFGATLLGEAVDYPTYLLTQMREGASAHEVTARIGRLLGLAVLTTVCGRVRAPVQRIPGLAQLGAMTVTGVLVAGAGHAVGAAARGAGRLASTAAAAMVVAIGVDGAIVAPRLALGIGRSRDGVRPCARVAAAVVG
jgi:predicted exporter